MPVAPALTCRRKIGAERPAGAALRILVVFSFGISQNRSGKRRANRERTHSITEAVLSGKPLYSRRDRARAGQEWAPESRTRAERERTPGRRAGSSQSSI